MYVTGQGAQVEAVYYLGWQRKVIRIEPAITVVDRHVNIAGELSVRGVSWRQEEYERERACRYREEDVRIALRCLEAARVKTDRDDGGRRLVDQI